MDKSFNFFKSKLKKETEKTRNYSKSNSSKASGIKEQTPKLAPLTQKQREIRAAIQARYQRSKLRIYRFECQYSTIKRRKSSENSSDCQEYQHLKKLKIVDLKQYHQKYQSIRNSEHSSRQRPVINLKLKLGGAGLRTQGDEVQKRQIGRSVKALNKNGTPLSKKKQQWRFISIQVREDLSKPKSRKAEVKINSHRSCTVHEGLKIKPNSSVQKGLDKTKPKQINRLTRTRF